MAIALRRDESVPRRPFTSVDLYQSDIATMTAMLEDLRTLLATRAVEPYKSVSWRTHGLKRRTIVCKPDRITRLRAVHAVGFFAERRPDLDTSELDRANSKLISEFRDYPGILSYSSFELANDEWANLVIYDAPDMVEYWRGSKGHGRAVAELAPVYYRNVRIHSCEIPGGVTGKKWIIIKGTKYWDYRAKEVWHAVRRLDSPITA